MFLQKSAFFRFTRPHNPENLFLNILILYLATCKFKDAPPPPDLDPKDVPINGLVGAAAQHRALAVHQEPHLR
jgi:hypothetical protein